MVWHGITHRRVCFIKRPAKEGTRKAAHTYVSSVEARIQTVALGITLPIQELSWQGHGLYLTEVGGREYGQCIRV